MTVVVSSRTSSRSFRRPCHIASRLFDRSAGDVVWEATGQATIVVNRIKAAKEIPADLNGMAATRTQLDVCAAETMPLPALLYQGGYLTKTRRRRNATSSFS